MKHKLTLMTVFTIGVFLVVGCGLFGKKGVSKEQMNEDIGKQDIQYGKDVSWMFKLDNQRCFAVIDDQSKITDSSADLSVVVSAWNQLDMSGGDRVYPSFLGKLMMHYSKNDGKWVLQNVEVKDATKKFLKDETELKKFLDITAPNCKYFNYTNWSRK